MSATVTVHKRNWRGEAVYSWQGEVASSENGHLVLRAVWKGPGTVRVSDEVVFEAGDVFYEHYYRDKPYGLWQVLTPDEGRLKGWYCNVSTSAEFAEHSITFRDLLLDVLLLPDGTARVLDREDLDRALAEGLDPALAALADAAVQEVLDLIAGRRPPFATISPKDGDDVQS
jgi:predicted RNA-binding protein associated with RNAse of E/G family